MVVDLGSEGRGVGELGGKQVKKNNNNDNKKITKK